MSRLNIKQINNSPAGTGDVITFNGTNNVWAPPPDFFQRTAVNATTYTIVTADTFIGVQHTSTAPVTLTLPATQIPGKKISIKDEGGNASINNITVNTSGGETLDGDTSLVIAINHAAIHLQWTGFEWSII